MFVGKKFEYEMSVEEIVVDKLSVYQMTMDKLTLINICRKNYCR